MFKKLPPEFYKWAREQGLPPRQPTGHPDNLSRAWRFFELATQWRREHKEAE